MPVGDAQDFCHAGANSPGEGSCAGFAGGIVEDFHIGPGHLAAQAGAEDFHDGFLGGEAAGEVFGEGVLGRR